jgi:hypothetical protein
MTTSRYLLLSWLLLGAALLLGSGCEGRDPITQAQASAAAEHLQRRDDFDWGDAVEVLPPAEVDERGRSWWQIRYKAGDQGVARVLLVDATSGWAKQPPPGYVVRIAPTGHPSSDRPVTVEDGSWLLRLAVPESVDGTRHAVLEREATRLNILAANTGLVPLFSLRDTKSGSVELLYGWQGDRGIARNERVLEWVKLRTNYHAAEWKDMAAP